MARGPAPTRSIQAGDIVMCLGDQWTVRSRAEEPGLVGKPAAAVLHLEREVRRPAPTPYGQKQKYKTVLLHKTIEEGRVRLLASQSSLFDL